MKKIFLLCACLLTFTCSLPAAHAAPPDVVVVRVEEWAGKITMVITRNGRPDEVVEFKQGKGEKGLKAASAGYQKLIQQLYLEGYALQGTVAVGSASQATLIFVKPQ